MEGGVGLVEHSWYGGEVSMKCVCAGAVGTSLRGSEVRRWAGAGAWAVLRASASAHAASPLGCRRRPSAAATPPSQAHVLRCLHPALTQSTVVTGRATETPSIIDALPSDAHNQSTDAITVIRPTTVPARAVTLTTVEHSCTARCGCLATAHGRSGSSDRARDREAPLLLSPSVSRCHGEDRQHRYTLSLRVTGESALSVSTASSPSPLLCVRVRPTLRRAHAYGCTVVGNTDARTDSQCCSEASPASSGPLVLIRCPPLSTPRLSCLSLHSPRGVTIHWRWWSSRWRRGCSCSSSAARLRLSMLPGSAAPSTGRQLLRLRSSPARGHWTLPPPPGPPPASS